MAQSVLDSHQILHGWPDTSVEQIAAAGPHQLNENHPDKLDDVARRYTDQDNALRIQALETLCREPREKTRFINEVYTVLSEPYKRARNNV